MDSRFLKGIALAVLGLAPISLPNVASAYQAPLLNDAYTSAAAPTKNFGTKKTLNVTNPDALTYLKFDLSGLPPGASHSEVTRATLRLWVNKVLSPAAFDVLPVNSAWDETTLTANSGPGGGLPVATGVPVTTAGEFVSVDVTTVVRQWLLFLPNEGFLLQPNGNLAVRFDSKEDKGTGHEPVLEIELDDVRTLGGNVFAGDYCGDFTTGNSNTGFGSTVLAQNTSGDGNTAVGWLAMSGNITGFNNTAVGRDVMHSNDTGFSNTAMGNFSLVFNTSGFYNTALGQEALVSNTTGSLNTAVGYSAGSSLTTGSGNINIGNTGQAGESDTIRIGSGQTRAFVAGIRGVTTGLADGINVMIDSNGQLGTISSSRRFKDGIEDMGDASARLMKLRPVTFRYRPELDQSGTRQYGLVAEEVAEVFPELVVYGSDGRPETVRYHLLNAMLLNEAQKQARQLETQRQQVATQQAQLVEQARQLEAQADRIESLTSRLLRIEAIAEQRGLAPALEATYRPRPR